MEEPINDERRDLLMDFIKANAVEIEFSKCGHCNNGVCSKGWKEGFTRVDDSLFDEFRNHARWNGFGCRQIHHNLDGYSWVQLGKLHYVTKNEASALINRWDVQIDPLSR